MPFSQFPEWAGGGQPINARSITNRTWPQSSQSSFAHLGISAASESLMQNDQQRWIRRILTINSNLENLFIIFYDSVTGKEQNIWSMFFTSQGPIQTPVGNIELVKRVYDNNNRKELLLGTAPKSLIPGWSNFHFTGQKME